MIYFKFCHRFQRLYTSVSLSSYSSPSEHFFQVTEKRFHLLYPANTVVEVSRFIQMGTQYDMSENPPNRLRKERIKKSLTMSNFGICSNLLEDFCCRYYCYRFRQNSYYCFLNLHLLVYIWVLIIIVINTNKEFLPLPRRNHMDCLLAHLSVKNSLQFFNVSILPRAALLAQMKFISREIISKESCNV